MIIDLRSDTVTHPTKGMKEAMFAAEVGDDVFEQDPTINALQEKSASMFGMEAALFCPSGTMTNQIAIKVHTNPPGQVMVDYSSHTYLYEGGGIAFNSGCSTKLLTGDRGRLTADMVAASISPNDPHLPETQLVALENTCNKGGGSIYALEEIQKISQVCKENGLKLHLDGARLFNALVETDDPYPAYGEAFDSISICLSKGLGAPVGSLLLGSTPFIAKSRRIRKVFGGGMRQAGFLAAAGIYALDHQVERLKEDHARARTIGAVLAELNYVETVLPVDTNIIIFGLKAPHTPAKFLASLEAKGILAVPFGGNQIRFVTHLDFTDDMMNQLIKSLKEL